MLKKISKQLEELEPKYVFNQKQNFKRAQSRNGNTEENLKSALVAQLQGILKELPDVTDVQIQDKLALVKDPIMQKLQILQKKANAKDCKQIQKLCMLAIGKRILNIQLRKKKEQYQQKQQKKSQIQEFFRQNRIKKFDYQDLIQRKLQDNTLIARPYSSGKGFVCSANDYNCYQQVLQQCQYLQVIKHVNKIFYQIFSGKKNDDSQPILEWIYRVMWVPILVFIVLIFSLQFYSFEGQIYVLSGLLAIILISLSIISIFAYLTKPNGNNQMEQTIQDTKSYFQQLNKLNQQKKKRYRWNCPSSFMYLQVSFNCDIHNM